MKNWGGWLRPNKCSNSNCCVEIRRGEDGMIRLRSSLSPYGVAVMKEIEFKDFVVAAKAGEYDHLYESKKPRAWYSCEEADDCVYDSRCSNYDTCVKVKQEILEEGYHGL